MSLLGARTDLRLRREDRPDLVEQLRVAHARLRGDRDLVELSLLGEEALRSRQVEARERRAADRGHRAEFDDARDPQTLSRPVGLRTDLLSELEVLLAGRRLVDHDLAGAGPVAVDQFQRVEPRIAVRDAEAKVRSAAIHDRLAVVADQLSLAVDARLGGRDAGEGPHLREQRLVERRRLRGVVAGEVEGRATRDDDVRALADVREDRVEGLVDRVGEDVGAADHRHTEHDRERGQRRPQLPPEQAPQRNADQLSVTSLIVAMISASLACPRSRTMRPSARKRTLSAIAAARASCVTMTRV